MEKINELTKILDELFAANYEVNKSMLDDDFDRTHSEDFYDIVNKIMHIGMSRDVVVFDTRKEFYFHGYSVFDIIEREFVSIYDQNQMKILNSGGILQESLCLKELSFKPQYWFIIKSIENWE